MDKKHVILYSGGLDSFLTYHHLKQYSDITDDNITLLYFNLGAKCTSAELELFNDATFKNYVTKRISVSDALNMGGLEDEHAYIPNRNILAAIMAHSITNADYIWLGGTKSDRVNDNNSGVCNELSRLLTVMHEHDVTVDSAFYDFHKCELVQEFVETSGWGSYDSPLVAQYALIYSTFSCYNPCCCKHNHKAYVNNDTDKVIVDYSSKECMMCPACFRKCMSLYAGGIFIPMIINESSELMIKKYYDEAKENVEDDEYMSARYQATIDYCNKLKEFCNLEI